MSNSCVGCKFLYSHDSGYSNWTVEDTDTVCALGKNPNLPESQPYNWEHAPDNWAATKDSRCEKYSPGQHVHLDVEGEDSVSEQTDDEEAHAAICASSGRES